MNCIVHGVTKSWTRLSHSPFHCLNCCQFLSLTVILYFYIFTFLISSSWSTFETQGRLRRLKQKPFSSKNWNPGTCMWFRLSGGCTITSNSDAVGLSNPWVPGRINFLRSVSPPASRLMWNSIFVTHRGILGLHARAHGWPHDSICHVYVSIQHSSVGTRHWSLLENKTKQLTDAHRSASIWDWFLAKLTLFHQDSGYHPERQRQPFPHSLRRICLSLH